MVNDIIEKVRYNLIRTYKYKLAALGMLACGIVPIVVDNDGTYMIFALPFAIGLLKEDVE